MLSMSGARLAGDDKDKTLTRRGEAEQKDPKTFFESKEELEHKKKLKEMITIDVPVSCRSWLNLVGLG
jgi:hypothetical protein